MPLLPLLQLLLPLLARAAPPSSSSCLTADTTWPLSQISSILPGSPSPEDCQELCRHDLSCHAVTWHTATNPSLPLSCSLFSSLTNPIPCTDCLSGPPTCSDRLMHQHLLP